MTGKLQEDSSVDPVSDPLGRAIECFNARFRPWEIELPANNVASRASGLIQEHGWAIDFSFGADEDGEYLDYYASHRMTDDEHVRLRADGSSELLPALRSMLLTSLDPVEHARLEREYFEFNKDVMNLLRAKGFRSHWGDLRGSNK